jgi:hypothetical protein
MKIYLLVCSDSVLGNIATRAKQTIQAYSDYLSASIQKNLLEDTLEKFQEWQDGIEDFCQTLNHDKIADYIDAFDIPLNWKYHNSDWRFYYGSKLTEPFIPKYFSYEIKEIEVEGI